MEQSTQPTQNEKKKNKGFILSVVITIVLMVFVIGIVLAVLMGLYGIFNLVGGPELLQNEKLPKTTVEAEIDLSADEPVKANIEEKELIDIDGDGIGELEFELGKEGLDAEYYPMLTNYIRHDLDYRVSFVNYKSDKGSMEGVYPRVAGNASGVEYINRHFYDYVQEIENDAVNEDKNVKLDVYVTYMDEKVISVVFIELSTYKNGAHNETLHCHTFDVQTGEAVKFELSDESDEFLSELEKRCMEESPTHSPILFGNYTKDQIRDEILANEDGLIIFRTPLGVEIGLCHDGYWCCSTFKDYTKYIKVSEKTEVKDI